MCKDCVPKQLALVDMFEKRLKEPNVTKEDVIVGLLLLKCELNLQQTVEHPQSNLMVVPPSTPEALT